MPPARPQPSDRPARDDRDVAASHSVRFVEEATVVLREYFGFPSFRPGQLRAIQALAEGRDCLCIMPTGSGKSLCYQVPALVRDGVTLVVSPLIALMKDQVDGLLVRDVPVTLINSTLDPAEQRARLSGMRAGKYRLIYVAPERFRAPSFRKALADTAVTLLAIDEAHCISQWGHDFRPDYRRLRDARELLGGVQTIALTATATPEVQDDIARELAMRAPERIVTGFDRPNLRYRVARASGDAAKLEELTRLVATAIADRDGDGIPSGIIYTGTRKQSERVAEHLNTFRDRAPSRDLSAAPAELCRAYHAGLPDDERHGVQDDFMDGRLPWVAATNAFGMGVDKSDIRFVVHFQIPGSLEAYYQEVGRAGRDGAPADCLLLFDERDRFLQEFFIEGAHPSRSFIESVYGFLWSLGENPIFRPLNELEVLYEDRGAVRSENSMAFRAAIALLERDDALERLHHDENRAEIAKRSGTDWLADPYHARSKTRSAVWRVLRAVFEASDRESVAIRLEDWSAELGLDSDGLRRAIHQIDQDGWIRYTPPFRGRAIRLPETRSALSIDFAALEEKKARERQRVRRMLGYARLNECRRDHLLRYFGADVPDESCGRCDICRSEQGRVRRALSDSEFTVVRKVLSGIARAQGRCGRRRIIQMLLGSRAKAVTELGLAGLSTWGILRGASEASLRELLDALEAADLFSNEDHGRYSVVRLTDRGVRVMKDAERLEIGFPPGIIPEPRSLAAARQVPGDEDEDLEDEDARVFQALRGLRRELASELGIPAYRVFNDRTLRAMARRRPSSPEDLLEVPGVGQHTLARFGAVFLDELKRHGNETESIGSR